MKRAHIISLSIALIATLWLASSLIFSPSSTKKEENSPNASNTNTKQEELQSVRFREIQATPFQTNVSLTGRSRAEREVTLKAETEGTITDILKLKGEDVKTGDLLAQIAPQDREARVKEAKERLEQRKTEYQAAKSLENKGFNSRINLAQATADLEAAKAALKKAQIDLAHTQITAPFEGIIYEQALEKGDYVSNGANTFTIVDLDPLEIVGFLSEQQIARIAIGAPFKATFMNGKTVDGTLSFIAPAADEKTRTFLVEMHAPNPDTELLAGLTAKVIINSQTVLAHKISPSILALNDEGEIGVKIIDKNDTVRFHSVKIIEDQNEGMWISGLPEKVRIITVGQDFVATGQKVKPIESQSEGLL
jgi:multidrug efflux system membrane fusion protein